MSTSRPPRYDWERYLPRLIDLYLQGLSFPDIHKACLQLDPNFTPSEKAVYNKLKQEGYPADKLQRAAICRRLNIARWPSEIALNSGSRPVRQRHPQRIPTSGIAAGENILREPNFFDERGGAPSATDTYHSASQLDSPADAPAVPVEQENLALPHSIFITRGLMQTQWSVEDHMSANLEYEEYCQTLALQTNFAMNTILDSESLTPALLQFRDAGVAMQVDSCQPTSNCITSQHSNPLQTSNLSIGGADEHVYNGSQQTSSLGDSQNIEIPIETPDFIDIPTPLSAPSFPPTPRYPGSALTSGSKARQLDRVRRSSKLFHTDRNSSATSDSGYASGRNSPFASQVAERQSRSIAPVPTFNGLHLVPCISRHEPGKMTPSSRQSPNQYRDVPTCRHCKYSSIHNLLWSAQYLKLEVVKSELQLPGRYDLAALDAAGNSGLHYAAIGGAQLELIAYLIVDTGIDPCQINTAGELFLHCMRIPFDHARLTSDEESFYIFRTNLVNLLNDLSQKHHGFLRWRDNTGKTALEKFVSNISDANIRLQVQETITSAGYPLNLLSNVAGEPQRPLSSLNYTFLDTTDETAFDFNKARQRIARQISRYASTDPTYVHPETGDSILHALARIRFQEAADLISRIREFASKDVDLNLRNLDEDDPLSAFTQEPHGEGLVSEETGATISKYLDALLWKDQRKRIPNKINVNMKNREGATPLYYAAVRARPDSVRSLIEAGANVNVRLEINRQQTSVLLATENERDKALAENHLVRLDRLNNVISYLEHENAVSEPTEFQERSVCGNTVGSIAANDVRA